MGWSAGIRFLTGAGNFSLFHKVQPDCGGHSDSYSMGAGGGGGKAAEVKNVGTIPPLPHMSSWHSA
jgi:hypothetical protein